MDDGKFREANFRDPNFRDPRGAMPDDEATLSLIDHPDSVEEIPTLDIAPYLQGVPGGREAVAARLREITMTIGFFYLKNHGIPQWLIDGAFAQNRRFHALPEEEKNRLTTRQDDGLSVGYRGYSIRRDYVYNTTIVKDTQPNLYAQFSVRREPEIDRAMKPDLGPGDSINLWPDNLPGFRQDVLAYHRAVEKLARSFLPLWATSLKLPLDYFEPMFETPHLQLALLHYPPQKEIGNRQYGIAPHTDNAVMVFLAQDIPGLAVRMPSGHWRAVESRPGTLLVNTGNTLVQWTNEDYLSTKHRVINTNRTDRYSIPVFFGPSDETVIAPLPACTGPDRPPLYAPITYGQLRRWYFGQGK